MAPSMPPDETGGRLKARVVADINVNGPMPLARYFEMAVADPQDGYWQRPVVIGASGDFITAPEISQIFGELVGVWCAVTWQGMGSPSPIRLIELGPGTGTLMRDLLRTVARAAPAFHAATEVHLVESSVPLREAQAAALANVSMRPPSWHSGLADVPDGPAVIVANEFLDALPIRQLVRHNDAWRERVVNATPLGELIMALGAEVAREGIRAAEGDILEIREGEEALLATIAARSGAQAALFIDYGPAECVFGDTLQAMRRHAYVDPLEAPGTCDLTAHVQFANVARKALELGLEVDGPISQAEFLGGLGLAPRASRLMAANPREAAAIELAAQRLVAPSGMGSLFKVLVTRTPDVPKPPPFR